MMHVVCMATEFSSPIEEVTNWQEHYLVGRIPGSSIKMPSRNYCIPNLSQAGSIVEIKEIIVITTGTTET